MLDFFPPSKWNLKIYIQGEKKVSLILLSSACKEKVSQSPELQEAQVRLCDTETPDVPGVL